MYICLGRLIGSSPKISRLFHFTWHLLLGRSSLTTDPPRGFEPWREEFSLSGLLPDPCLAAWVARLLTKSVGVTKYARVAVLLVVHFRRRFSASILFWEVTSMPVGWGMHFQIFIVVVVEEPRWSRAGLCSANCSRSRMVCEACAKDAVRCVEWWAQEACAPPRRAFQGAAADHQAPQGRVRGLGQGLTVAPTASSSSLRQYYY